MRICFIGDSFVNGTNDPDCLGWVGRVAAKTRRRGIDLTVYNLGIRRDTSADIAARWQAECQARLPPDMPGLLVFSFGVNDCSDEAPGRPRVPATASLGHAGAVLSAASRLRPTLMVGPPPIDDGGVNARIATLAPTLAALCADLAVPFLDVFPALSADSVWRAEVAAHDGAHPGAAGYAALAELVTAWPAWWQAVGASP